MQDGSESHPWIPETYTVEAPRGGDFPAFKRAYDMHIQGTWDMSYVFLFFVHDELTRDFFTQVPCGHSLCASRVLEACLTRLNFNVVNRWHWKDLDCKADIFKSGEWNRSI